MKDPATQKQKERETRLQAALPDICRRYGLHAVYAFGSRAQQIASHPTPADADPRALESDVDIGILPAPGRQLSAKERVSLARTFEDLLAVQRVDLVILPEADPFLAANIVRGERLWAKNTHAADEYDLYVLRRAGDLAPLERERMALILGERS